MTRIWNLNDFSYKLPQDLIAQHPEQNRSDSRVLQVDVGNSLNIKTIPDFEEFNFSDLASKLQKNDLLIFNNSKVIPASLKCEKKTGGKIELLVIEDLSSNPKKLLANALIKSGKKNLIGQKIRVVGSDCYIEVKRRDPNKPEQFLVKFLNPIKEILDQYGEMPLPPYIKRKEQKSDKSRYQNIFANTPGSIAAPTAGLHFDNQLFKKLIAKGINFNFVTLHVGIGTFMPIRTSLINKHKMHEENCEISESCSKAINYALKENHRIIAVGTTSLRLLESLMLITDNDRTRYRKYNPITPQSWKTNLFIKPGFKFRIVDGLITNFHLPKSTLLILICSFLGHKACIKTYEEAVKRKFRFFSYGDAMIAIKPLRFSCNKNLGAN